MTVCEDALSEKGTGASSDRKLFPWEEKAFLGVAIFCFLRGLAALKNCSLSLSATDSRRIIFGKVRLSLK